MTGQGRPRWVLEIPYRNRVTGKRERYRQDATVQTSAAAHEEERRLLTELHEKGFLLSSRRKRAAVVEVAATTPRPLTFAEACDTYRETKAVSRLKYTTRRGYEVSLKTYLLPRWQKLLVTEIGFTQFAALDAELTGQGLKPMSRANIQCAGRSVLRHCVDAGILQAMPRLPRLPKQGERILKIPDEATINEMLAAAKPYLRLVLLLCVDAGLRAGEVRGMTWKDVDLKASTLVVRETVYHGHRDTPKSGREREIHLTPRLQEALAQRALAKPSRDMPLAPNSLGRVWGQSSLAHAVSSLLLSLGKDSHRFHDLRHYFVTRLFKLGVGAPTVRDLAGHKHMHVTARYAHSDVASRRQASATLRKVAS